MTSFRVPRSEPVRVTADARFRMDGKGRASADACNSIYAGYDLKRGSIAFREGGATLAACGGQRGELDRAFNALFKGDATWSIPQGRLTIKNQDGWELAFRRAASVFPRGQGKVVLSGMRGSGEYELRVAQHGGIWGANYLFRTAPGTEPSYAGVADDVGCLATSVIQASWPDGETFVFGWVTPQVARVAAKTVEFGFHSVPGTDLRIAAAWVPGFKPSRTTISWYDAAGTVLAAYPHGPC